jgi:hypothetical protein
MNRTDNMADFPHTTLDSARLIWWFEHFATTKNIAMGSAMEHCESTATSEQLLPHWCSLRRPPIYE